MADKVQGILQELIKKITSSSSDKLFVETLVAPSHIEIEETGAKAELKKVRIENLPKQEEGNLFWLIHLEKEVQGFNKVNGKTVEAVLLHLQGASLTAYFIELKSNRILTDDLKEKIEDSISRLFFIFLLRFWEDEPDFLKWKISYRYVLCFRSTKGLAAGCSEIEDGIRNPGEAILLEAETLLGNKPVTFKAFQTDTDTYVIQWEDLP
jgi:hypothetical protein